MKKIISCTLVIMLVCLTLSLVSCGGEMAAKPFEANISVDTEGHSLHYVEMTIKNYGTVSLTLDASVAPITVTNFLSLVNSGYFNNTKISRLQHGFVMQNAGGEGTDCIKGEFAENGVKNDLLHKKGVLSMARNGISMNSASDQFFIMLDDNSYLDGSYAGFGWVTAGMNILEAIEDDISTDSYIDQNGFLDAKSQLTISEMKVTGNNGVEIPEIEGAPTEAEPFSPSVSVNTEGHTLHTVEMSLKGYGKITMVLDETVAPITVQNFLKLVNSGYYDGLNIIRMNYDFVVQIGGGAETDAIKGEFSSNGVPNGLLHRKGILSMARSSKPDSASNQFFIMLDNASHLNGDYAAFGWVTSGMNILEYIESNTMFHAFEENSSGYNMGFLKEEYQPVIEYIKVID
ncbi:MAG: peptidylprolyl isomerase [Clostridia bacterium]|nr:peptidylprolyl isomerase [Clostridia bacterium]